MTTITWTFLVGHNGLPAFFICKMRPQGRNESPPKSSPYQRRSETRRRQGESVQLPDEPMRCLANAILTQAHETAAAII